MADMSKIRETSILRQRLGEVKCGCLEGKMSHYVKPIVACCWHGEMAALVHMCIRHLSPPSRTPYRVVYRRISGGVM